MAKVYYDPEVKILNISIKKGKIIDSDMQGNCVIDYDKNGDIVNIEVLEINLEEILKAKKRGLDIDIES